MGDLLLPPSRLTNTAIWGTPEALTAPSRPPEGEETERAKMMRGELRSQPRQ